MHGPQKFKLAAVIYYSILTEELLQTDYGATTTLTTEKTIIFQNVGATSKF